MIKPKKDKVLTIRISEKDYDYLRALSFMGGMTVSKYTRTLLDASINAVKLQEAQGRFKLEDIKSVLDNKL